MKLCLFSLHPRHLFTAYLVEFQPGREIHLLHDKHYVMLSPRNRCYRDKDLFHNTGHLEDWLDVRFSLSSPFSLSCWVLSGDRRHASTFLSIESPEWKWSLVALSVGNGQSYFTGKIQHGGNNVTDEILVHATRMPIVVNTWYNVALVREMERLRIYVNGTEHDSAPIPWESAAVSAIRPRLCLGTGATEDRRSGQWDGQMQDTRVWDRALSGDEVKRLCGNRPPDGGHRAGRRNIDEGETNAARRLSISQPVSPAPHIFQTRRRSRSQSEDPPAIYLSPLTPVPGWSRLQSPPELVSPSTTIAESPTSFSSPSPPSFSSTLS
ncbi:hypothetical protein JAAARDRAFT_415217 [Jaapia argillacea MUCL 33604]|uniref:LamG-like jellyroll fold domain-containing protein n=1 Tax=Jaapia argillacea MUCL 33604 TaxID=933084 RepID=A0A067PRE2_9AGAM|nr:hypothetical protein JAAARDRAFT_415217 [Jaapia argillacea MUCL 33604]